MNLGWKMTCQKQQKTSCLPLTFTFIAVFSSAISASMASSLTLEERALHDLQHELSSTTFAPPASTSSLSEETFEFGQFIVFLHSKLPRIPLSLRFEIAALSSRDLSCQRHQPRRSRCPSCGRTPAAQTTCGTEIFAKDIEK